MYECSIIFSSVVNWYLFFPVFGCYYDLPVNEFSSICLQVHMCKVFLEIYLEGQFWGCRVSSNLVENAKVVKEEVYQFLLLTNSM